MSWLKRRMQALQKQHKPTVAAKAAQNKIKAPSQAQAPNTGKAKKQALAVGKDLKQKGYVLGKGVSVNKPAAPSGTPNAPSSGWRPPRELPARGRARSKGKGMSR